MDRAERILAITVASREYLEAYDNYQDAYHSGDPHATDQFLEAEALMLRAAAQYLLYFRENPREKKRVEKAIKEAKKQAKERRASHAHRGRENGSSPL